MDKGEGPSRRRAETVAPQPQMRTETSRSRAVSETVGRQTGFEVGRLRTSSAVATAETRSGGNPQTNSRAF